MTSDDSITTQLASLAHPVRFAALRLLVRAGPGGLPAGRLAARLDVAANALTFHLHRLTTAGLAISRRDGQFIFYTAQFEALTALAGCLTNACCAESADKCSDDCPTACDPSPTALMFTNPEKDTYDG